MLDSGLMWAIFGVLIIIFLLLDILVFQRHEHEISLKEAILWTIFWIIIAMAFNAFVYYAEGQQKALLFLTSYIVEKSLSMDNLFVFIMIFNFFRIPPKYQHKVLFLGILGALFLRMLFIFSGIALIHKFEWITYIFGIMLIYSGYKMFFDKSADVNPENNIIIRLFRKIMPVKYSLYGSSFFTLENTTIYATPLFITLLVIESSDVVFAVDSIPAVLAITQDKFIAYTSNIMAILGLRALYFVLYKVMKLFHFLHYGLSAILTFVGIKMLIKGFIEISSFLSLLIIISILLASIMLSIIFKEKIARN